MVRPITDQQLLVNRGAQTSLYVKAAQRLLHDKHQTNNIIYASKTLCTSPLPP